MIYELMHDPDEETTVNTVSGWMIERENHKGQYLFIRNGRYIEWTTVQDDALQFERNSDAAQFAEFYFGSPTHGHSIVAHGTISA